jgi:cytochrome c oxidase subunit 1
MILPAMGVISEMIACVARRRIFGYSFVAFSSLAIAIIGFFVWGHHLYVSSQSVFIGTVFSLLTFIVAIPSAIKTFNWTATMYKGSITYESPMVFVVGFLGLFLVGGLTGLFLANTGLDVHLHDTYFVVAHFHYIMVGGAIMGFLGGLHFYWPKITGKLYPETWAKLAGWLVFVGFNLTFFPQFIAGYIGMPRRYHAYPPEFQIFNILSTGGAGVLGLGYMLTMVYLTWSLFYGKQASANPWRAKGLEWTIASPPPPENFAQTPIVTEEAYEYSHLEEAKVA